MVLLFVFNFADANRRALISRLNEQRQAKLRFDIGKAELRAVGAGECDKRGDGEPGVAQQTFGHVFVHTGRRAQHIGADERQIRHAQHPCREPSSPSVPWTIGKITSMAASGWPLSALISCCASRPGICAKSPWKGAGQCGQDPVR